MPGGRPIELTQAIIQQVKEVLPIVLYLETCADYIGVHRTTFRRWYKRGRKEISRRDKGLEPKDSENLHVEFCITYKRALAEASHDDQTIIKSAAGKGAWQAAAWREERRWPKRWGRSDREDVSADQSPKQAVEIILRQPDQPTVVAKPNPES